MIRPFLLIDVDGVLCPDFAGDPLPGYERFDTGALEVWLWTQHGVWLNHLATRFDLVWASTWEHDANDVLAPVLGLPPDMPVIEFTTDTASPTWKLPDIQAFVGDRPFAWIDDDLGADATLWANTRDASTLLVHTNDAVGMTQTDVKLLERFAMSVQPHSND